MPFITIRRARTWHYRKMRPCIEQSNGPVSLSLSQSCPDCIINTSGYDFRKGQALMRAIGLVLVSLVMITSLLTDADAASNRWCASSPKRSENCGYATLDQCR